ncbi:hypothetical protein BDR07DRAFT_1481465 [Suillus spraguei]|nr:hypothetical protein BDR07DRAFT_1481465 [Suillus spraguei]
MFVTTAVDDSYWDTVDAIDLEGFVEGLTSASSGTALEPDKQQSRCTAIIAIKCVVILSILMQGMNQKSNALQSILSIFLQSVHVPQKVIDTLSHMISDPESIDKIPLVQTPLTTARAMDINNSTITGNIQAIVLLLAQGRVHDPADTNFDPPDISQHVVLFHGDLGAGKRLQAAQLQRSIEAIPWDHLQHVIFIPGLFHPKMACVDAI